MKAVLQQLVAEALTRGIPEGVPRDCRVRRMAGKVSVLAGMRRTGKTYLCYQRMRELLATDVPRDRLLYLNFEDDRLAGLQVADLRWIVDAFYAPDPAKKDDVCWFFLDEIQRVPGWESFLRRLLDTERVELMVTGSSAKLLSREIGTAMRGRSLTTEVFPLSFREYCGFHGVPIPKGAVYGARERLVLRKAADAWLATGGFPEVQHQEEPIWRAVLQEYVDVVILRDVMERHGVANHAALRALTRHILQNSGQLLSVSRLSATFAEAGIACGKNTLFDLLDHLRDAYFCFPVEVHDRSLRRRQVNPRKVYAADAGLCRAFASGQTRDAGAALEGAVFRALRARGGQPDYVVTPQGFGVDFVVEDDSGWHFIQSCLTLENPATAARELRALEDARALHPRATCTIVTYDEEDERDNVHVIPLWRWLLDVETGSALQSTACHR